MSDTDGNDRASSDGFAPVGGERLVASASGVRSRTEALTVLLDRTIERCTQTARQARDVLAEGSVSRLRHARSTQAAHDLMTVFASVMRAVRTDSSWRSSSTLTYQHLIVHPQRQEVECAGRSHLLTRTEWQLLAVFLSNPGKVLNREELATLAWGGGLVDRSTEVEVYISRLRRKVELDSRRPRLIETVRGSGYRLSVRAGESMDSIAG